ncbi:integrase [Acidocella aquatica]|uniref:Integrase n=2 Tax=Acidocella aquatica TaxID=1922313 RepID=A0ABQ6A5M1_9PROT|nr:integrase [Acidocella aquatica]
MTQAEPLITAAPAATALKLAPGREGEGAAVTGAMPAGSPAAQAALAAAIDFAGQALSPATLRAYRSDWAHFCAWCRDAGWPALPAAPETVAAYLASLFVSHARSALVRRLAAMSRAHRLAGADWPGAHPKVRNTLQGIRRNHSRVPRQAAALTTPEVRELLAACDYGPVGLRDRALLLIGYAGALRRSELVAIEREHVNFDHDGLRLTIPRAKGDQTRKGATIGIPRGEALDTCPVRALEAWLRISDCQRGPVFRSIDRHGRIGLQALHADAVRQILTKRAAIAGLVMPNGERLSPHGLRAGFITQAYVNGARDEEIMDHTRQKDLRTMRGYVRRAKLVTGSPARLLGL